MTSFATADRHVLVTGAAGFVGSHVVELLAQDPRATVTATDIGSVERLTELGRLESVTSRLADLRDPDGFAALVAGADVVVHLAAVRTQASANRPRLAHEVNVGATYDLLAAARDAGCRRVVFGSSHTVYGSFAEEHREPFAEDAPWVCSGINMYAATKLAAEAYLESFASSGGPEYLALRLGNIYGPRTSPGSNGALTTDLIRAVRSGETLSIPWASSAEHALIHVQDVAEAIRRAVFVEASNMAVNVAGSPRTSREIYGTLAHLAGADPESITWDEGRTRHQLVSQARMKDVLGFTPAVGLEDGLRGVISWYDSADPADARD
jgi:UDP-glucose 4-epimerase